uniref:Integral membrane family protein n=1 Tax=Moniliophthora roreri TaxID=221103 RepID=A0A0W0G5M7_MONRR
MASDLFQTVPVIPIALATLLGIHGLRKKSLSPSGAATAFIFGVCVFAGGLRVFGVGILVFYLGGSRATKCEHFFIVFTVPILFYTGFFGTNRFDIDGKKIKAQLEDGYHEAGYRTGWQVMSNGFSAVIASILWNILFSSSSVQARIASELGFRDSISQYLNVSSPEYNQDEWCPVDARIADGWSRALIYATVGHFACCLGDTLASELGILSKSRPILITTLKPVPPGTNGGMSVGGTLASVAGGLAIGVSMALSLVLENAKCRQDALPVILGMVFWGSLAGGLGSLADSFLGATVQQTRYSEDSKKILQDESVARGPLKVISGWNILTNNQVNVLSSILTSLWMSLV